MGNQDQTRRLHANLASLARMSGNEHDALELEKLSKAILATDMPAYLDPTHPRYSHMLAAAVHAWEVTDGDLRGKTPKNAMRELLEEPRFGLSKNAARECATVANWSTKGGAPTTPGTKPNHPRKPHR